MTPDDAAAAWLARIPESERLAAAAATDWRLAGWAAGWAIGLAACALVARSGLLRRIRDRLEANRPRPWLTSAACAGVLAAAVGGAMALTAAAFAAWVGADASLGARLGAAASQTVAVAVLVPPVHWLMRRRPGAWPFVLGPLVAVLILAVGWLPYVAGGGAGLPIAPPSPAQAGVLRLVAETHLPAADVRLSPDPAFDADVTGGFGRATVVLGPVLAAGRPAEARAYVGHLMGHYVHEDILAVCLLLGASLFLGMLAARRWAAPLARALGARDAADAADPLSLPGVALLGLTTVIVAGLVAAAYLRWANVRADAYSLDHAREPDGLAAVIEREWDRQAVDPSPLAEAVFYTHPPLAERLRQAMAWKAAHGG